MRTHGLGDFFFSFDLDLFRALDSVDLDLFLSLDLDLFRSLDLLLSRDLLLRFFRSFRSLDRSRSLDRLRFRSFFRFRSRDRDLDRSLPIVLKLLTHKKTQTFLHTFYWQEISKDPTGVPQTPTQKIYVGDQGFSSVLFF